MHMPIQGMAKKILPNNSEENAFALLPCQINVSNSQIFSRKTWFPLWHLSEPSHETERSTHRFGGRWFRPPSGETWSGRSLHLIDVALGTELAVFVGEVVALGSRTEAEALQEVALGQRGLWTIDRRWVLSKMEGRSLLDDWRAWEAKGLVKVLFELRVVIGVALGAGRLWWVLGGVARGQLLFGHVNNLPQVGQVSATEKAN